MARRTAAIRTSSHGRAGLSRGSRRHCRSWTSSRAARSIRVASVWLDGRDSRCGRSDTRIQHEIEIGGRSSARMERDEEVVKSFLEKQILEPLQIASASGSA
jgi:hypothetical protein